MRGDVSDSPGGPKLSQSTPVALGLVATLLLLAFNVGDRWAAQREQELAQKALKQQVDSLEDKFDQLTSAVTITTTQMGHLLGGMRSLEQTMKEAPPRRQR